jgi:hypothetical protein
MPSAVPSARRRKARRPGSLIRAMLALLKFAISPAVLLCDSFQAKQRLDRSWMYSFFLLITLLMGLTGIGILVTDGPFAKTLRMMAAPIENQEVLSGDLQPVIRAINQYALENNLDPNLIFALVKTESHFRTKAVSRSGARGLMQIMPEVWRHYSNSACSGRHAPDQECHAPDCIFEVDANIRVGTKYFRELLDQYDGRVDLALEAYNAGISNVVPGLTPKYEETRSYVRKTVAGWQELRRMTLAGQLQISLRMQSALKVLFGLSFLCWLIFFGWAMRKLFPKG